MAVADSYCDNIVSRRFCRGRSLIIGLLVLLPVVLVIALFSGAQAISPWFILEGWVFSRSPINPQDQLILSQIRLPRVLLAAGIGALLAMSGAIMQGLFRNPLADPSLIGVTAGASVGASLCIVLLMPWMAALSVSSLGGLSVLSLGAFIGAIITVLAVYRLAIHRQSSHLGVSPVATMLLVGIAISALAAAVSHLLQLVADNHMLRRMTLWQMGNLDLANWPRVGLATLMLAIQGLLLRAQASSLNALLLGESEARALGVDTRQLTRRLITVTALGVGMATALAGTIGFVGLIVPHVVRLLSGPNHQILIPASGLLGAILLVSADLLARSVMAPAELPVGVITALLGVPFFLMLIRRQALGAVS